MQHSTTQHLKIFWTTAILSIVAGVIYNSWPLGYVLNPAVSQRGLASELAAFHQPYNWVFILLDVLSGLLVAICAGILWRYTEAKIHKAILVNFALFGMCTLIDALLPLRCNPSISVCPGILQQPELILHGAFSMLASICLLLSVVLTWYVRRNQKGSLIVWAFIIGWSLFGIASVYFFFLPGPGYLAQHYYITLCSLWVAVLPFVMRRQLQFARATN